MIIQNETSGKEDPFYPAFQNTFQIHSFFSIVCVALVVSRTFESFPCMKV